MGGYVDDETTASNMHRLSTRFAAGDAIAEMTALHRQFGLFKPGARLKDTFKLLNIAPESAGERRRWFHYLEHELGRLPSDVEGVNGHDRMVQAYRENLESAHPVPMHARCHSMDDDPRVLVTTDRPLAYVPKDHLVVSFPTRPGPHHT